MNQIKLNKSYDRLDKIMILLVAFCLSLPIYVSSISIILFILYSITKTFKDGIHKIKWNSIFYITALFLLPLFSLIISGNLNENIKFLEKNLSFLILPIAFTQLKISNVKQILVYSAVFVFLISGIFLVSALINVTYFNSLDYLFYTQYSSLFSIHPVYFGMYFLMSSYIILKNIEFKRVTKSILVFYIVLILVLISSKIIIFAAVLLILFFNRKNIVHSSLLVGLIFLFVYLLPFTRNRIQDIITSDFSIVLKDQFAYNESFTGLTFRLVQWKLAIEHLYEDQNFYFGLGVANSQEYIDQIYKKHNLDAGGYLGYNLHNIYLDMTIKYGLFGLFIFLYIIFDLFYKSVRLKIDEFKVFLLIFLIVGLTEDLLGTNKGIVYFAFYGSLIYQYNYLELNE